MSGTYLAGFFSITAVAVNYFTQKNNPDRSSMSRIFSSLVWANGVTAAAYKIKNAQFVGKELLMIFGALNVTTLFLLTVFNKSQPKSQDLPYQELPQCHYEIDQDVKTAVSQKLKLGQTWELNLSKPWSLDSLNWVIHSTFATPVKIVYLKKGCTEEQHIRELSRLPKGSVVITYGEVSHKLPSTLYHIELTAKGDSLACFDHQLMITLHHAVAQEWARQGFQIDEPALEILSQFAEKEDRILYRLMWDLKKHFNGKNVSITKYNEKKLIARGADDGDVIAYNKKIDHPLFYSEKPFLETPKSLRAIEKNQAGLRQRHVTQILKALGAPKAPHAFITGMDPIELEYVLSCIPERPVFHFEFRKKNVDPYNSIYGDLARSRKKDDDPEKLIRDYLSYYPDAILYIDNPHVLIKVFQKKDLIGDAVIVTSVIPRIENSDLFSQFKGVSLIPLSEDECLEDIRKWANGYRFEDNALEVAVAAAFLLRDKPSGEEFGFIQDLIERSSKRGQAITVDEIWETFRELHYGIINLETKSFANEPLPPGLESTISKTKSLLRISLALKKKFKVELVCDPVKSLQPPELLRDLNVELEGAEAFATDVGGRVGLLTKALRGRYTNALIIGPAGVGKTTLVRQAAWMAAHGQFEEGHPLFGKTIYSLSPTSLMAGAQFIGTFEERIEKVFNFLLQDKNAVLFVDEIHLLMGSGASRGNQMGTVAQHLKPYLEESGIMVIGATTEREFNEWVQEDEAFVRRFNALYLKDVSDEEAVRVLEQYSQSETFREINKGLQADKELLKDVVAEAKKQRSDVGLIDRAKKILEKKAQEDRL